VAVIAGSGATDSDADADAGADTKEVSIKFESKDKSKDKSKGGLRKKKAEEHDRRDYAESWVDELFYRDRRDR